MLNLLSVDITTQACRWISLNPSYVLWPVCLGVILLIVVICYVFKLRASKKKVLADYDNACESLRLLFPLKPALDDAKQIIFGLETDKNRLSIHNNVLCQQINDLSKDIVQKESQLQEKEEAIQTVKGRLASLRMQLGKAYKINQQLQEENQSVKDCINKFKSQIDFLNKEVDNKNAEIATQKELLEDKSKKITVFETRLSERDGLIEEQNTQIVELETRLQSVPDVTQLKEEIELYIGKLQSTTAELDSKESELKEALNLAKTRGDTVLQLQEELRNAQTQITRLEEQLKSIQEESVLEDSNNTSDESAVLTEESNDETGTAIEDTHTEELQPESGTPVEEVEPSSEEDEADEQKTTDNDDDKEKSKPEAPTDIVRVSTVHTKHLAKQPVLEEDSDEDVDLPTIEKSTGTVKRSILQVIDVEHEEEKVIDSDVFFNEEPEYIERIARMLAEADESGREAYVCACCMTPVKISKRDFGNREILFFSHCRRDINCEWKQDHSRYVRPLLYGNPNFIEEGEPEDTKVKYRKIKELIIRCLKSERSSEIGISNVEEDKRIKSQYKFMRPRIAGIYASYNERDMVFELQTRDILMNTVVNKDIFYRLNDHHVVWIFGADEGSGYDYIIKHVNMNTMFANRRNVFIMDKETMEACEERKELVLKCNYLDPDNKWHYRKETTGNNGVLITLENLQFDEDMCKPYYYDANIEYFKINPKAEVEYHDSIVDREKLLKDLRDTYEGKIAERRRKTTKVPQQKPVPIEIPSIEEPKPVVTKTDYDDRFYFFYNGKYGIVDANDNFIIPCEYNKISCWTKNKYRVLVIDLWGVIDENQKVIIDIKYRSIGELVNGKAIVKTAQESYQIDEFGNRQADETLPLQNGWVKFRQSEKWGIRDKDGSIIVECVYDEIGSFRNRLIGIRNGSFQKLTPRFDYRIRMHCKCSNNIDNRAIYNINGLVMKEATKIPGIIGSLYFNKRISNIDFSKNAIYVSDLTEKSANKKFDHVDNDYDFATGETLIGTISRVSKNKTRMKYYVLFEDRRITYFGKSTLIKAGENPANYDLGKKVTLQKTGYDSDVERTEWKLIK